MLKKGQVSSINLDKRTARVVFLDLENTVSAEIPYAPHVALQVNDYVAVAFFSGNMADGLIISSFWG